MRRRWRVGLASNPKVLGLVTAVVLIVALLVTGRVLNSGGESGSSTPATGSGPRQQPGALQDQRQGPVPAGALEIGGVYLTPTSPGFRAGCHQVAERLGFAVPCPGLLPTTPPGLPPPTLCDEQSSCRRGELLGFILGGFVVPTDYIGAPGMQPYGGLEIWAAPAAVAASRPPVQCLNERRIATLTVHHTRAVLADCPDTPGRPASVLLRWSEQGTFVILSVLGSSEVNQRLVVALADHLRLVPPGG